MLTYVGPTLPTSRTRSGFHCTRLSSDTVLPRPARRPTTGRADARRPSIASAASSSFAGQPTEALRRQDVDEGGRGRPGGEHAHRAPAGGATPTDESSQEAVARRDNGDEAGQRAGVSKETAARQHGMGHSSASPSRTHDRYSRHAITLSPRTSTPPCTERAREPRAVLGTGCAPGQRFDERAPGRHQSRNRSQSRRGRRLARAFERRVVRRAVRARAR